MVILSINISLFIIYVLIAMAFNISGFPWWSHLLLGIGMCAIVIFANIFLYSMND